MNSIKNSRKAERAAMQEAVNITNKMIRVYKNTPIEKYPEARALDVLDELPFNSSTRQVAFKLFTEWREYNGL